MDDAAPPWQGDVKPTDPYHKEITWLADTGISTGWDDGTFRPWEPINRDAMAAFLSRMAGEPTWDAPAASPFVDVTTKTAFYDEITWLADAGISKGWNDKTYRPLDAINRDAMAAFLYRFVDNLGVPQVVG